MSAEDVKDYQDAVWDFVLEHCDITENGAYFVKFHTTSRANLEKRLRARIKHNYHRIDDRTGETHKEKEERATKLRTAFVMSKEAKRERWEADRDERKAKLAEVKRQNELRIRWGRWYPWYCKWVELSTSLTRFINRGER